jgi:hypothetical protein
VLADSKDKIAEADATDVKAKVAALRETLGTKDVTAEQVQAKADELTRALHGIATKLYQAGTPPPTSDEGQTPPTESSPPPSSPSGGGAGPVDADFKVVDKDSGEESGKA